MNKCPCKERKDEFCSTQLWGFVGSAFVVFVSQTERVLLVFDGLWDVWAVCCEFPSNWLDLESTNPCQLHRHERNAPSPTQDTRRSKAIQSAVLQRRVFWKQNRVISCFCFCIKKKYILFTQTFLHLTDAFIKSVHGLYSILCSQRIKHMTLVLPALW